VLLNGEDVSQLIRTPEMNSGSSKVATIPCVRHYLVKQQRQIASGRQMVCEGRDQGTIVFPQAGCKFFLVASAEARARRRFQDLVSRGHDTTLEKVLREQEERDHRDSTRGVGALKPAEDAIHLDTSTMTINEVLAWMEQKVRERCPLG
jgi:cytidylate kinase